MATTKTTTCAAPGCSRGGRIKLGFCEMHYQRWSKTGSLEVGRRVYVPTPPSERFWMKVDKTAGLGPDGDCWEWGAWRNRSGYGQFNVGGRKRMYAHAFAWRLTYHGPVHPEAAVFRHSCDNPPCANPFHVYPGTHADNKADCLAKGREARGDGHGMTKIPESSLSSIRARLAAGERPRDIAQDLGAAEVTIAKIKYGSRRKPAHARSVP